MNSSIYYSSSILNQTRETQKQSSKSIDFLSVNSSCITNKELKSINNFRSNAHNNYYKNMKKNKSLLLNLLYLNNLDSNFYKNKNSKHNFYKTKSCDSILPNIFETHTNHFNKNLKINIFNNDNLLKNNKNKSVFNTVNKSNYSTTFNSLITPSKSNISNNKSLKNEYSYINLNNNNILSLNNLSNIDDNNIDNIDNFNKKKFKRENLYEYLDKTKKIIIYKYQQNNMKKLLDLEKEKIETNIEKYNLDLNLLQKINFLFKKYIYSFDNYFFYLKEDICKIKAENTYLIEKKKQLSNEIFILGHSINKIKNKLKDYLSCKFFLLSVKNHTKILDFFSSKDKNEFNNDLSMLNIIEKKINSIISNDKEKIEKKNGRKIIRRYSLRSKEDLKNYSLLRRRFYSQKNFGNLISVKNLFDSPKQFIKDLNLISKDINISLQKYNDIQLELLEHKKMLNNLNKKSFENENIEKEFLEKEYQLKTKLKNSLIYYNYLKNNKNIFISKYKINYKKEDLLLIKIKYIINNIKNNGDEKLLEYIDNLKKIERIEKIENKNNNYNILNNYKLTLLKRIENIIIFLQKNNNEYKEKENERYLKIEENINYLKNLNNNQKTKGKEKSKKKLDYLKIFKKNYLLFLSNKNNYYINNKKIKNRFKNKNNKNKKNEEKINESISDVDLNF